MIFENYIKPIANSIFLLNKYLPQLIKNEKVINTKKVIFFIFFLIISNKLPATTLLNLSLDSIPLTIITKDTIKKKKGLKHFFKADYPSPKKAALLAIVPGMGQIYNKKYWKLPIIYGALGGVIYAIDFNTKRYNDLVLSLGIKAGTEVGTDPFPNIPENALSAQRNITDKNRQMSWIGVFAFYLLSAGDALVDAHLKNFSVDDDLSFRPIIETGINNQPILGVGIQIPLSR